MRLSTENAMRAVGFAPEARRTGPASVQRVLAERTVEICFEGDARVLEAQLAAAGYDGPREGDRVLALVDDDGRAWIIGLIARSRLSLLERVLAEEPQEDEVSVHDRSGRLVFSYDRECERAVLHVPAGDLNLNVPAGALRMQARDGVCIDSEAAVRIEGAERVELAAAGTRVSLQPGELSLVSNALTAAARRAEIIATDIGVKAHAFKSRIDRVRHVVGVLDVRATRIVERAKDAYREVERLSQTRAGRLRMVAKEAVQIVGENALFKARDRVKIKGERIHLA